MTIPGIDLSLLANAGFPQTEIPAGDVLFTAGDPGDFLYVVRSGEIEIEGDGKVIETLSPAVSSGRWR